MMKLSKVRRDNRVTMSGMTKSQPGVSVSVSSPVYDREYNVIGSARLHVTRHYDHLPNKWGGHGVSKSLDCDGMIFDSIDEAFAYAFERGYEQEYWSADDLRQKRMDEGYNPKTRMFEGPNPPSWWVKRGRKPLPPLRWEKSGQS